MPTFLEAASIGSPGHLVDVQNTEWAFWRCIGLRSAGFPASNILKLAAPEEIGAAADELDTALRAKDVIFKKAICKINSALGDLRQSGDWENKQRRNSLLKARRKLEAKQASGYSPEIDDVDSMKERLEFCEHVDTARESFEDMFSAFSVQTSQVISEIAGFPTFREAVTWQNRKLVPTVLDALREKPTKAGERTSHRKQHEEMIATYLQRYCMKNDTIGFFGPVGWGKFVADGERIRSIPGPCLLAARQTYWEAWPIEKLSSIIAQNPGVLPWLPPFTMPFVRLEGVTLHRPFGSLELTPSQAAVIQACNGRDPANQIAREMLRLGVFNNEEDVYRCLRDLAGKCVIFWSINIPLDPYPERALRRALEGIGDASVRRSSLEMLDQLDSAKQHVATMAGNAEKLGASFDCLEETFTRLTSEAATRYPGKTYAGRTLVYEDCRRDLEVSLGPELLQELVAPLSLLLVSARWLTAEIREAYGKKMMEVYTEIVAATGQAAIDAALFWVRLKPFIIDIDARSALTQPIEKDFQARWNRVFRLGRECNPVNYPSDSLRERVLSEFPAGQAEWKGARYHSPDIMIAAASEDAIRRGDYCFVLGELHTGMNTLGISAFVSQHPSPQELVRAVEHDLGALNVVPVTPKKPKAGSRMEMCLVAPSNLRLEYSDNAFLPDRSRCLPISSFVIEFEDGRLLAKTRDGRLHLDAIDLGQPPLPASVINSFKKMASQFHHSPRISIDRLVVQRESWRCTASELAFAREPQSSDRYAQTRKWRHLHAMPRFVFFKAPVEPKPCYLDFESPILVDIFCKMVRRTQDAGSADAAIDISEMLPTPDQIWLTDAENNRYTNEFRFVIVDLKSERGNAIVNGALCE